MKKEGINVSNAAALIIPIILVVGVILCFVIDINFGKDVFTIRSEVKHYLKSQYDISIKISEVDYFFKGNMYTILFYVEGDEANNLYKCYKRSDGTFDDDYLATFWTDKIENEVYRQMQVSGINGAEKPILTFDDDLLGDGSSYSELVKYSKEIVLNLTIPVENEITDQYYQGIIDVIVFMKEKEYAMTKLICTFKRNDSTEAQIIIEDPLKKEMSLDYLRQSTRS